MNDHAQGTNPDTDVLIIGAGVPGIGLAYYLQRDQPNKRFTILESRRDIGGTWDLFRYPGIRSDSDLYTFGYEFNPWKSPKAIADAATIMDYLREAVDENQIQQKIRFNSRVKTANWSSADACWHVEFIDNDSGITQTMTSRWLFSAAGYYNYEEGFTPEFNGRENFKGQIIHPQHWPENLDYKGKKVVVIGSGATAVTLVPAMAKEGAQVTMLQRSPTYIATVPEVDPISVGDIRHLVADLKKRGIGVLITDHNVRETLEIVDRAYILHDGKVLMSGTPDEVVENENVRRVYLGENFRIS